jgi:hypothetical protein
MERIENEGPEGWEDQAADSSPGGLLALDEEERLPWLESADDDVGESSNEGARLIGFVLVGLLALAVIVGGVWFATHRGGAGSVVADGSTIKAPAEPYKKAPANPGGKTFAGTGDTSYAVSEGQTRPAKLEETPVVAKPVVTPSPVASASPKASAKPAPEVKPAPDMSGVGVQVGAYFSQAAAEAGWNRLSGQHEALKGFKHRIVEGSADIGNVYRLQAVTADVASANALCADLKSAGLACQVKR